MARRSWLAGAGLVLVGFSAVGGASAQTREPVMVAPLTISPPPAGAPASAQQEWERAERARQQLNTQRERDRLDLEGRQRRNEEIQERTDRGLLGAPVYVQPGPTPYYAAPQYAPGYGAPGYAPPGSYGATLPPGSTARMCQQTAPAYDEAGRFLATVCVR